MNKFSLVCCLGLALVGCKKKQEPQPAPPASGSGSAAAPATGSATGSAAGSATGSAAGSATGSAAGSATETGSGAGSGSAAGSAAGSGAGSAAASAPDEKTLREGKKTGLGAPDEKPEVITEELIRQIAAGKVPPKRFIDPKLGVLDWTMMPGAQDKAKPNVEKQRCADAEAAVVKYAKAMVANETKGQKAEYGAIFCDNAFAATEDREFGAGSPEEIPTDVVPMKHVTCGSPGEMEYAEDYSIEWVPDGAGSLRIAALLSTEHGARVGASLNDLSRALKDAKPCK